MLLPLLRRSWRIEGHGEPGSVGTVRVAAPAGGGVADAGIERTAASTIVTICFLTGRAYPAPM